MVSSLAEPISPDDDFKIEHYRRIVFANEKFGGRFAGWKTDRGRLYVIFGPPDFADRSTGEAARHSIETWHYPYIKGIGESVQIRFEYTAIYDDYVVPDADRDLVGQALLNPEPFPMTPENMGLHVGPARLPKTRFKDLEVLVVTRMVHNEVKFNQQIEFSAATHASTLARIDIQIPSEICSHEGQAAPGNPLFVRVSKPSGHVVAMLELVADVAMLDKSDSKFTLTAHLDVLLAPGTYQLAIAAKNAAAGEAGILRNQLQVPTYESLGMKN